MIIDRLQRLTAGEPMADGVCPVGVKHIEVGPHALESLDTIVSPLVGGGRIVLLQDATPMSSRTGDLKLEVRSALEALGTVDVVVLSGAVHADEQTVADALARCAGADVVVTVGSGTICDIGKVAAGAAPHVVVQTAASVDGYADDQSVLLKNGVKRTTHSAWPHALIVDSGVLARAPRELNRSGLGDTITMFTAPADWYLAHSLGMVDGFNQTIALAARGYGDVLLELAPRIGDSDEDALELLGSLLALRGMAMGAAGQTSPGSGMEHTVSHLFDMVAGAQDRPVALHGAQVGISTIAVARLWHRIGAALAAGELEVAALPSDDEAEGMVRAAFLSLDPSGAMAAECWADYALKLERMRRVGIADRVAELQSSWSEHARVLDAILIEPRRLSDALDQAGAPSRFPDLSDGPSSDEVIWALASCHLMRNRFTVADLAFITGRWTPELIAELAEPSTRAR